MHASELALGKQFNITNDQPMPLIDLLHLLFTKLRKDLHVKHIKFNTAYVIAQLLEIIYSAPFIHNEPPLTRYTVGLLAFDQTLNIDSAKQFLNYSPIISIEEGLERFAASLQQQNEQ